MNKLERLDELIQKGRQVIATHVPNPPNVIGFPTLDSAKFGAWRTQTLAFLESFISPDNVYLKSFDSEIQQSYRGTAEKGVNILETLREDIERGYFEEKENGSIANPLDNLLLVLDKFHDVSRQLRSRYNDRSTLNISDEYDVQDLLHALLRLYFEDIRPEEWTPSYAGQSARMDFLLKNENIVIEVKKTRKALTGKEVGNQLIEDIERYKNHQDCDILVCFVYDPEGLIGNPRGIENDLNRDDENIHVRVFIKP